jgi:hypothetical protein
MLVNLELVKWSDVEPFIKQFDALDVDGSGRLTESDLALLVATLNTKVRFNSKQQALGSPSMSFSSLRPRDKWRNSARRVLEQQRRARAPVPSKPSTDTSPETRPPTESHYFEKPAQRYDCERRGNSRTPDGLPPPKIFSARPQTNLYPGESTLYSPARTQTNLYPGESSLYPCPAAYSSSAGVAVRLPPLRALPPSPQRLHERLADGASDLAGGGPPQPSFSFRPRLAVTAGQAANLEAAQLQYLARPQERYDYTI